MDPLGLLVIGWTIVALIGLGFCSRLGHSKLLDIRSTHDAELRLIGLRTMRTYLGIAGVLSVFALIGFRALVTTAGDGQVDGWSFVISGGLIAAEFYLTGLMIWLDRTAIQLRRGNPVVWNALRYREQYRQIVEAYVHGAMAADEAMAAILDLRERNPMRKGGEPWTT